MNADDFKAWRKKEGLSLNGAAERLGVSRQSILYWQSGERPISRILHLACLAISKGLDSNLVRKS